MGVGSPSLARPPLAAASEVCLEKSCQFVTWGRGSNPPRPPCSSLSLSQLVTGGPRDLGPNLGEGTLTVSFPVPETHTHCSARLCHSTAACNHTPSQGCT